MVGVLEREGLPLGDRGEEFLPSGLQKALDRSTRDAHLLSGLFLLFPFEIAEAHRFQLVQSEFDDL